ncbi:MAG: glycosyltransferase family 32 protein [Culicoidibacterales bacterium]
MIPKKIHYCWFGRGQKNELVVKCIETWKTILPEYEIIEWNEEKINWSEMPKYVIQAYEEKKWAFVSDYIRMYALYDQGGVYFDTDIELLRSIDTLLSSQGFTGFQHKYSLITAICAAKKGNAIIKEIMEYYHHSTFIKKSGELDLTANPVIWGNVFKKHDLIFNDKTQVLNDNFIVYNSSYFGNNKKNSYLIHHFEATWTEDSKTIKVIRHILQRLLGKSRYNKLMTMITVKVLKK